MSVEPWLSVERTCIECGRPATGVQSINEPGLTAYAFHCADAHHALCARRAVGLPDVTP